MSIGPVIARLREQRGWSQGQLSVRTGIMPTQISRAERGIHETINARNLAKLAQAFGVTTDYMMQEAGWLPRDALLTNPGSPEQRLVEAVRSIPSPQARERALELFIWVAEAAAKADAAGQQ